MYSDEYVQWLSQGPFPGRIDPWAEIGRYFQQIHAGMIGIMLDDLRIPLLKQGYRLNREASLQIAENREPDLAIRQSAPQSPTVFDYVAAATAIQAESGIALTVEPLELDSIHIKLIDTGELVTIVEIVSPRNKVSNSEIYDYEQRRQRLIYEQRVNVVEIDLTRSVKRLIHQDKLIELYPYHLVIYLPHLPPASNWH